jgi:AraC-like DNA-binding protein
MWQVDRFNSLHKEQIIPKGVVEIIFNFSNGSPINAQLGARNCNVPNCFINGFNTTSIRLDLPRQQVFFGIQLQPSAVKMIIGAPASVFADQLVDLTLLSPAFDSLWHQLAEQKDFAARVAVFCNWVTRKCLDTQAREKLINDFLYGTTRHDVSVKDLATELCYSPRHLSRKIFDATGMNTEEMLLYKKYLHAIHLIHHSNLPLTKIAYQCRFADQSHFIKTFKAYSGLTPGEYNRRKGYLPGHIFQNVR